MTISKVHVIGAGLSGLCAAVALSKAGVAVEVSEAAAQAGGRCRSYFDPQLGATIDNGNHFVFSGNQAVKRYLAEIGSLDLLVGPEHADYPFLDLTTGERWTLRPNDGPIAWWVGSKARRVPGTRVKDYLALINLLRAKPGDRVCDLIPTTGPLWTRLIEPMLVGALNTEAASCSALLAAAVMRETLARGGHAYKPRSAKPTLGAAFVDPALTHLERHGAAVRFGRRLRGLAFEDGRVRTLHFADGDVAVAADHAVVLAVPAWVALDLVPQLTAPVVHSSIVNCHFERPGPKDAPLMQGVLHGVAQWVFGFTDRISTTTSGADAIIDTDRTELATALWADVVRAYALPADAPMPAWQIVKEKRATFAATPEQDALRPPAATAWRNLILAGDWIQTGLPATIEGSLRSGYKAAGLALAAPPVV